ncbi:MAG: class I SAM-dependent methyltransferase, partial [bacterium]
TGSALHILDLGCGDASIVRRSGIIEYLRSYTGIDRSEQALEVAQSNLADCGVSVELQAGDYREDLSTLNKTFDAIVCGFTLHHQSAAEKANLMAAMAACLEPGGQLFLYDESRNVSETEKGYIRRLCASIDENWNLLNQEEKQDVLAHIQDSDSPASHDELVQLGHEYFGSGPKCLYQDPGGFYAFYRFRKAHHPG